jgi:hypothetical protein
VPDVFTIVAEQQNRAEHAGRLTFDQKHQPLENFAERRISRNHFKDSALGDAEIFFSLNGVKAGQLGRIRSRAFEGLGLRL